MSLSRLAEVSDLPGQWARSRGFRLGAPGNITVSPDGRRIVFLRSRRGDDPATGLWVLDLGGGNERLVVDPAALPTGEPTREERIRRERTRDYAEGITDYATDRAGRLAAFAVAGRLWLADLDGAAWLRELPASGPVADPRPSPDGSAVAYESAGALRVIGAGGSGDRALAVPDGPHVQFGLPEHVAAEEMYRRRGHWWAPDGSALLVARVDTTRVRRFYLADPASPDIPPVEIAYPPVGTPNADVSLWLVDRDGNRTEVNWDRAGYEYMVAAHWSTELLVVVQSRNQRTLRVLTVDPVTGATVVRCEDTDPCWVEIVPGAPALTGSGSLVRVADRDGFRRLLVDDVPVTPNGLNVRRVLDVDDDTVLFAASDEPTEVHLWTYKSDSGPVRLSSEPGVHTGHRAGGTTVVIAQSLEHDGSRVTVHPDGGPPLAMGSLVETPVLRPRVELFRAGERELRTAVLLPSWHVSGSARLPVLLDPYGGPAAQRVLAARNNYLVSQWFAEQGFAVVVADGRGTPGRGPAWERTIFGDKAGPALEDQIIALRAAAERFGDFDLDRVGIRGWSYGGFLAAQAVLRRPDVFHVAVAGAAVTDQRFYDTHFNERYLGQLDEAPEAYERCDLIPDAPKLRRPLLLIHGLADDNVLAAHTFRLSAALLAAGRPHTVLPLPGATHRVRDPVLAERLFTIERDFLLSALA